VKKTVVQAHKKEIEKLEKSLIPGSSALTREWPWPRDTTAAIALTQDDHRDFRASRFRDRLFQEGDLEAIFEYIAVAGEYALKTP
jgi:hypothetical protein